MFAESLSRVLSDESDIEVVGVATNGPDAVRLAHELRPTVMLVDYMLPGPDGVAVAAEIKRMHPEIFVVMLTASTDDRMMLTAIDAGCSGFLTKDRASADVAHAVRDVANGEALIPPGIARANSAEAEANVSIGRRRPHRPRARSVEPSCPRFEQPRNRGPDASQLEHGPQLHAVNPHQTGGALEAGSGSHGCPRGNHQSLHRPLIGSACPSSL